MPRIVEAVATVDYRLRIRFDDGAQGEVDLSDMVGRGVFQAWSRPEDFVCVSINPETGTVTWPGGIDLCPDRLYCDITGMSVSDSDSATQE